MKVFPEAYCGSYDSIAENAISLPQGIIGFSEYRRAELLYMPDHLPFLWMKLHGASGSVNFVVIEPGGIVPNYELEVFDNDAEYLALNDPA